jgi:hypothetical protein
MHFLLLSPPAGRPGFWHVCGDTKKAAALPRSLHVKNRDFPNLPPKMILTPTSIPTLLKIVSRVFKFADNRPASTIFDENGQTIDSINQIEPGATVYASSRSAE